MPLGQGSLSALLFDDPLFYFMDSGRKGVAPGCGGAVGALLLLFAHGTAAPSLPLSLFMMFSLAVLAPPELRLSACQEGQALPHRQRSNGALPYNDSFGAVQRVSGGAWLANALLQPQQQQAAGSFMRSFALIWRHPRTLRVNRSRQPMTS